MLTCSDNGDQQDNLSSDFASHPKREQATGRIQKTPFLNREVGFFILEWEGLSEVSIKKQKT
jgi:hypothetical protein